MLDRLSPAPGAQRRPKRVGRGPGSGIGKTSGRGVKGQGKRSAGRPTAAHTEGGQMPLVRRLPKRGFTNIHRKPVEALNVGSLARLGDGATVDAETLASRGLIPGKAGIVKLLGEGEAPKNLKVRVHRISASARQKVEAAGGSVEIIV
jgi:large subunit ribosomal protein L15